MRSARHPAGLLVSPLFPSSAFHRRLAVSLLALFCALLPPAHAQTAAPPAYYDSAIGLTGSALKAALHTIVRDHTVLPYTSPALDTWDALMALDEDPAQPDRVLVVYSGASLLKSNQAPGNPGSWNREHFWPQSYGLVALNANSRAKTDLFNLWPAEAAVNSSRGNKPYDYSTVPYTSPALAPGTTYDIDSWEPRDADKGAVARAAFYMAVRYDGSEADVPDLELAETPNAAAYQFGHLSTLLAWHRRFPATPAERERNQRIYATYQHNRNPFIDRPENADMIFLGATPAEAWRKVRFSATELASPEIGGDLADPDRDGFANVLEYALSRDPRQPDSSPACFTTRVHAGATDYLHLTFHWNRYATDIQFSFEGSGDLQTWTPVTAEIIGETVVSATDEEVTVRIAVPSDRFFVCLRVTK